MAERLGLRRPPWLSILVGGTNGKGSTVAHLEALLRASGVRVGAFTSPHLRRYNERIRIDGTEAGDAELVAAFERIERARGATTLTFFEYNTLAALELFTARGVAIGLLEVGLGGRLDATNLIDADVAVLCSVGFDHMDWLGPTLEEIGREKAGIFRPLRPAILGSADLPHSVFETIERLGARRWTCGSEFRFEVRGERWDYVGPRWQWRDLPPPRLAGAMQYGNAASALAALEALGDLGARGAGASAGGTGAHRGGAANGMSVALTREAVVAALTTVQLPGRLQSIPGEVEWILDVAHNAPAAETLAHELARRPCAGRTHAVAGILRDKDAPAIGAALAAEIDDWVLCTLSGARGTSAAELAERLAGLGVPMQLADDVASGCRLARERARPGDRIVVFGSFHTVGPALDWLGL